MTTAAVILCLNHTNLGMYSVDLAAQSFFAHFGIEPHFFCAHNPPRRGRTRLQRLLGVDIGNRTRDRIGRVEKRFLGSFDQLADYDLVCYWGDFTTNPVFLEKSFHLCESFAETFGGTERWRRIFGPEAHHPLKVSIGQSFQQGSLLADPEQRELLRRTIRSMKGVFPRDRVSSENLRRSEPGPGVHLDDFLDCAFFLIDGKRSPKVAGARSFGYFFGRSGLEFLVQPLAALEATLGLQKSWLEGWLTTTAGTCETDFARNLEVIRGARFVVTDTYHVAVNCLRERTLPIVLGRPTRDQDGTLGDFKKKVLMEDLGLSDLHLEVDATSQSDPSGLFADLEAKATEILGLSEEAYAARFATIETRIERDLAKFSRFLSARDLPHHATTTRVDG